MFEIAIGDRFGRSDIDEITTGFSIWGMGYRYGIRYIDMVIYHIDIVILNIGTGYGRMIWEMTESIWSSLISIWDIFSLWVWPPGPSNDRTDHSCSHNYNSLQWCRA